MLEPDALSAILLGTWMLSAAVDFGEVERVEEICKFLLNLPPPARFVLFDDVDEDPVPPVPL